MRMNKKSIVLKKGNLPGKTLTVFAGVHGNEKAGVMALKKIIKKIRLKSGSVYFVFANPAAIGKNIRQVEKNLNRCFLKGNQGKTLEDKRARQLMKILDTCDALLDLHASNTKKTLPFIICERPSFDLASKMNFGIVSSGWDKIEPGAADGYVSRKDKIALCVECGSVHHYLSNIKLAEESICQFLQYFEVTEKIVPYYSRKQKLIKVFKAVHKKTNQLHFSKIFKDFHVLTPGETIARDGGEKYIAGKNQIIIFPNPNKQIGEEIFILGKIMKTT